MIDLEGDAAMRAAEKHARTHSRTTDPPHWLRCNGMRLIDGISYRCLKGDGHIDRHQFVDVAEHDVPRGTEHGTP